MLENGQAEGVKGGHMQPTPFFGGQHLADARLHLARRLVGEGDGIDMTRRHLQFAHEVGDFGGNHASFTRASTGQNQKRSVSVGDGGALRGIEGGEHGGCGGSTTWKCALG